MGIAINCRGCGQPLQTSADDTRLEVECLWCGVKSPVPGRTSAPPAKTSAIAAGPPPVSAVSAIAAGPPPRPLQPTAIAAGEPPQARQPAPREEPASGSAWHEQTPYGVEGPPIEARRDVPYAPSPMAGAAL